VCVVLLGSQIAQWGVQQWRRYLASLKRADHIIAAATREETVEKEAADVTSLSLQRCSWSSSAHIEKRRLVDAC
jgi:hypothetical protein